MKQRADGELQPGVAWGPFRLRVPFYHFRAEWPEMVQGLIVAGPTGLALIPILQAYFHVSFEVGLAVVIVQSVLLSTAPLVFGDPYCHGWVTPAIPLVLAAMAGLGAGPDADAETTRLAIETIVAFTFLNAAVFLIMAVSGLGRVVVGIVPVPIKAGIVFGAAVAAFMKEFPDGPRSDLWKAPCSCVTAFCVCLILMYALPVARLRERYRLISIIAGLGLAPGFVVAMFVGYFTGEVSFSIEWGFQIPPFGEMWHALNPFGDNVSFPSWEMYRQMLPLSLVVYIIAFGDIVTAEELLRTASRHRPDEQIDINATRAHLSMGIRNAVQGLISGPFPVVQGTLWTGVQVVVTERYKQGRRAMDSIYGGISAYYLWGIPFLFFVRPVTSFLEPMLPVALSLTLLLTGYACGYISIAMPRNHVERGIAMTTGMVLAVFGAWQGMLVGIVMTALMIGRETGPAGPSR